MLHPYFNVICENQDHEMFIMNRDTKTTLKDIIKLARSKWNISENILVSFNSSHYLSKTINTNVLASEFGQWIRLNVGIKSCFLCGYKTNLKTQIFGCGKSTLVQKYYECCKCSFTSVADK